MDGWTLEGLNESLLATAAGGVGFLRYRLPTCTHFKEIKFFLNIF